MPDEPGSLFVPIKDETGKVTGVMDRTTADYLASVAPNPTQASIDALLATVTRVKVVPTANYHAGATELVTLLDTSDPESVATFRTCFAISEDPHSFGHCMCFGEPQIELFAGDVLIANIGCHHGYAIRWEAWKHDAVLLTPGRLLDWMTTHGVDGPRKEVEESRRRAEQSQRDSERWWLAMPECLRSHSDQFDNIYDPQVLRIFLDALREAFPTPEHQVLALYGLFGSGAGSWNGYPSYEVVPFLLLRTFPTRTLIDALRTTPLTDSQWLGAARFFTAGQRRESGKRLSQLTTEMKQRMLAATHNAGIVDNIRAAERFFNELT